MPLSLLTLSLVDSPVTLQEGLKILERDDYRCQYCGLDGRASFENSLVMRVDFVVPRARKGKKEPGNLVACCTPCNTIKGTRVYANFSDAKAFVLKKREELRKNWESRVARPLAKAAKG
jgi:5-methylcytosine-specific restriction endonuclease McrA